MTDERGNEERLIEALDIIRKRQQSKPFLEAKGLNKEETVVVVMDMLKGFAEKGILADPRIGGIVEPILELIKLLPQAKIVFLNDAHSEDSLEFSGYPKHCMRGTEEAEIVDELKPYALRSAIIEKNSTNGFVSEEFQDWFKENKKAFSTYIVVGDCTDICIKQFVMTLKAWYHEHNESIRVIVPINVVETFDLQSTGHYACLMNLISFYEMEQGGIEIVRAVE